MFSILFSKSIVLLLIVGLGTSSRDLGFGNFEGVVSPSCFELVAQTHVKFDESFQNLIFPL